MPKMLNLNVILCKLKINKKMKILTLDNSTTDIFFGLLKTIVLIYINCPF